MARVVALRHVAFEDCGTLEAVLAERGHVVEYLEAPLLDWSRFDALEADLLVVLGGPISANDEAAYRFLTPEIAALRSRLLAGMPLLGFCLGAQLMARALGARVYPAERIEIGWAPLTLTAAAGDSAVAVLDGARTSMLHWHGENFELPEGGVCLASTPVCRNQIASLGSKALAFQCHPEVDPARFELWLVGHTLELARHELDPCALRAQTRRQGERLAPRARACFEQWLHEVGL